MANVNVIDISEWQDPSAFDYAAAKAAGIKAVIIRLSTGLRADKAAAQHIANCDKYGLIWHGYHYWYNQDGEAAFAVKNAQQLGLASTKRFFLDMEDKSLDADWASQFEGFRQAIGSSFKPGLYCSDYPFKQHFNLDTLKSEGVYLWIASYSYEPANYDIWQVSGAGGGGFGSYTGDVDRDTDKTGELIEDQTPQPPDIPTEKAYQQIVLEYGYDTENGIYGKGYSPDNGKTFCVTDTTFGRRYRQEDADRIWPYLQSKIGTADSSGGTTSQTVTWDDVQNKPDVALKSDLTWDNIQNKPDLSNTGSGSGSGSPGKSAYQIWIDAGNQGTEADFLKSLKGDTGYLALWQTDSGDINFKIDNGYYDIRKSADQYQNLPGYGPGALIVMHANSRVTQIYQESDDGKMWTRISSDNGSNWTTWMAMTTREANYSYDTSLDHRDLNNIDDGVWEANNPYNAPDGAPSTIGVTQETPVRGFYHIQHAYDPNTGDMWTRQQYQGTWTTWKKLT